MSSSKHMRPAFTLVELLAVIAMIGILAAILIPVVGSVMEQADTAKSTSNLRQLGNATSLYVADNDYEVPMLGNGNYGNPPWYITLSGYIGITQNESGYGFFEESTESILSNPATDFPEYSVNYAPSFNTAAAGSSTGKILKMTDVKSPSSKSWLITTSRSYFYNPYNQMNVEYPHNKQANVLFFDGSVALVAEEKVVELGRDLLDPWTE
ncbi:prepilin-type N-terminal cleavage/methylation domain-containing protein [Rubellicoccus peritrichatus]|uniref:Prepilin-type N-terminal cleavage/methylation domain-containing protein n=1 Tax=Rubellicoccus peritrichatus TaxID=3080537 RepID=A0AAQ3LCK6_9BACT|nr:prepilin-type N-terminal cleavage/methylation domain-containing protein [Puniceicoccus sp. CR14]WOO41977.1 prepilin-type N-terminal cleavage/methylation domain-containing protein [Puniceicoccus sp. CR14]